MLQDDSILADTLGEVGNVRETSMEDATIFDLVLEGRVDLVEQRLNELQSADDLSDILNEVNQDGCIPIHYACWVGSLDIVQLLHNRSKVNQLEIRSQIQCTPLHYAAWSGVSGDLCRYLVQQGANIESKNEDGFTPLILSVRCGNYDTSKALLDCCSIEHVNDVDTAGCTAFHHACHEANEEMCRLLLAYHADPLAVDNAGLRPFDICHEDFSQNIRQIIYEHGDDEDEFLSMGPPPDEEGNTNTGRDNIDNNNSNRSHHSPQVVQAHPPAHAQTAGEKYSWFNLFGLGSSKKSNSNTDAISSNTTNTLDPQTPSMAVDTSSASVGGVRRSPDVINLSPDPDDEEAERLERERIAEEVRIHLEVEALKADTEEYLNRTRESIISPIRSPTAITTSPSESPAASTPTSSVTPATTTTDTDVGLYKTTDVTSDSARPNKNTSGYVDFQKEQAINEKRRKVKAEMKKLKHKAAIQNLQNIMEEVTIKEAEEKRRITDGLTQLRREVIDREEQQRNNSELSSTTIDDSSTSLTFKSDYESLEMLNNQKGATGKKVEERDRESEPLEAERIEKDRLHREAIAREEEEEFALAAKLKAEARAHAEKIEVEESMNPLEPKEHKEFERENIRKVQEEEMRMKQQKKDEIELEERPRVGKEVSDRMEEQQNNKTEDVSKKDTPMTAEERIEENKRKFREKLRKRKSEKAVAESAIIKAEGSVEESTQDTAKSSKLKNAAGETDTLKVAIGDNEARERVEKEIDARQMEAKEREAQEKAALQKAVEEREAQEKAVREKEAKEREAQAKAVKEREAREKVEKERDAQEKAAKGKEATEREAQVQTTNVNVTKEKVEEERKPQEEWKIFKAAEEKDQRLASIAQNIQQQTQGQELDDEAEIEEAEQSEERGEENSTTKKANSGVSFLGKIVEAFKGAPSTSTATSGADADSTRDTISKDFESSNVASYADHIATIVNNGSNVDNRMKSTSSSTKTHLPPDTATNTNLPLDINVNDDANGNDKMASISNSTEIDEHAELEAKLLEDIKAATQKLENEKVSKNLSGAHAAVASFFAPIAAAVISTAKTDDESKAKDDLSLDVATTNADDNINDLKIEDLNLPKGISIDDSIFLLTLEDGINVRVLTINGRLPVQITILEDRNTLHWSNELGDEFALDMESITSVEDCPKKYAQYFARSDFQLSLCLSIKSSGRDPLNLECLTANERNNFTRFLRNHIQRRHDVTKKIGSLEKELSELIDEETRVSERGKDFTESKSMKTTNSINDKNTDTRSNIDGNSSINEKDIYTAIQYSPHVENLKSKILAGSYTIHGVDIEEYFDHFDKDHSGTLERREISFLLKRLVPHVTDDLVSEFINAVDVNGDGEVSKEELIRFLKAPKVKHKRMPKKNRSTLTIQEKTAVDLMQLFKRNEFSLWLMYSHYCPNYSNLQQLLRDRKNENFILHSARIACKYLPCNNLLKLLADFGVIPRVCSKDYITKLATFINLENPEAATVGNSLSFLDFNKMLMITAVECIHFPEKYADLVDHDNDVSYIKISLLLQHIQKSNGKQIFQRLRDPINIPNFKIDPLGMFVKKTTPKKQQSQHMTNSKTTIGNIYMNGSPPITPSRPWHDNGSKGTCMPNRPAGDTPNIIRGGVKECPPLLVEVKRKLLAASYTSHGSDVELLFDHIDTNHSGYIDKCEFRNFLKKKLPRISDRLINDFIELVDDDEDGKIDKEEFKRFMYVKPKPPRWTPLSPFPKPKYDSDGNIILDENLKSPQPTINKPTHSEKDENNVDNSNMSTQESPNNTLLSSSVSKSLLTSSPMKTPNNVSNWTPFSPITPGS